MVYVKQVFGVFILATAAYYGYEAYALFSNRWVDPTAVTSSVQEQLKAGWHSSLAEGLDVAKRENKPVLIDMWATWCKNCLTMDVTTMRDPAVVAALDGYVKIGNLKPRIRIANQRKASCAVSTQLVYRPTSFFHP